MDGKSRSGTWLRVSEVLLVSVARLAIFGTTSQSRT
jgi:hypothetical protein